MIPYNSRLTLLARPLALNSYTHQLPPCLTFFIKTSSVSYAYTVRNRDMCLTIRHAQYLVCNRAIFHFTKYAFNLHVKVKGWQWYDDVSSRWALSALLRTRYSGSVSHRIIPGSSSLEAMNACCSLMSLHLCESRRYYMTIEVP